MRMYHAPRQACLVYYGPRQTWAPREHVNDQNRTGKVAHVKPFFTCEGSMFDEDRVCSEVSELSECVCVLVQVVAGRGVEAEATAAAQGAALEAADAQAAQSAQALGAAAAEVEELRRKLAAADDDLAKWKSVAEAAQQQAAEAAAEAAAEVSV